MKENYVKAFLKKFWWVPLSLTLLLLISLGIYLYVFRTKLFDTSAWASLVSGIFTYIGSSFLGVVVFYHSWLQTQITNKLEEVDLIIQSGLLQIDGQWCPFSEKDLQSVEGDYYSHRYGRDYSGAYSYLKFEIINNNIYAPVNVQFVEVFFLNEKGNIEQCHNLVYLCDTINSLYLSKDSKSTFYCGVPTSIIDQNYYKNNKVPNLLFVFKARSSKGNIKYYIEDYIFDGTVLGMPRVLSQKEYESLISKAGANSLLTHFNKQAIRKRKEKQPLHQQKKQKRKR